MNGILFVGDPHGEFGPILKRAEAMQPEAIILLGDQTPDRPLAEVLGPWAERTWYILGNHDSDQEQFLVRHLGSMSDRNLNARVRPVAGVGIAGLGGVFRSQVWYPPSPPKWTGRAEFVRYTKPALRFRGGLALRHWTSVFLEDVQTLARLHADVLVTHEAPSTHRYGFDVLDDLAWDMGVRLVVHGHHHEPCYEAELFGGIHVVGLGKGEMMEWRRG